MRSTSLACLVAVSCFAEAGGTPSGSAETSASTSGMTTDPSSATVDVSSDSAGPSASVTSSDDATMTTVDESSGPPPETCSDAILNAGESDVDCGGTCPPCALGEMCIDPTDCESGVCASGSCIIARACSELPMGARSGLHPIDPDGMGGGPPFDVVCEMERAGGGWTLAIVSSHDELDTWIYADPAIWSNNATVGAANTPNHDLKSPAAFAVPFRDLLFIHQPSDMYAAYADVTENPLPFTAFMDSLPPPPVCGPGPGQGIPMTEGTIVSDAGEAPVLWDTALFFNRGDFDIVGECANLQGQANDATWGPTWNAWVFGSSAGDNQFNDPFAASFGPASSLCVMCGGDIGTTEHNGRGFGAAIGATVLFGTPRDATNYIQMYVR